MEITDRVMNDYAKKIAGEVLEADVRAGDRGVHHPPLDWHRAVALARAVISMERPEARTTELEKKVAAFSMLPDGWNSYGAKAFPPPTISLAMEIARKLGDEWKAVPIADGGIEFYRNNEDEIVEVRTCFDDGLEPQSGRPK